MNTDSFLFTSESVSEGHPDKICDQISDAILDAFLEQDPHSRVACETVVTTGLVFVLGEVTSEAYVDVDGIARGVIKDIGYTIPGIGFDYSGCSVLVSIHPQSADISGAIIKKNEDIGAGDQGIMFGYACDETPQYMPATIQYSHLLMRELSRVRKFEKVDWLYPDSKSQVTVEYHKNGNPKRISNILISTQHAEGKNLDELKNFLIKEVVERVLPSNLLDSKTNYIMNPSGRFVMGGPSADTGLTGRKIVVDTYGGWGSTGGGAFSGKDPSKVDRSASYMSRYVAKNVVAAGLATRCSVQVSYAIGISEPVSIWVTSHGTSVVEDAHLARVIQKVFDFRPKSIIQKFDLLRPIYKKLSCYGHFGRDDLDLPWEKLDAVDLLLKSM